MELGGFIIEIIFLVSMSHLVFQWVKLSFQGNLLPQISKLPTNNSKHIYLHAKFFKNWIFKTQDTKMWKAPLSLFYTDPVLLLGHAVIDHVLQGYVLNVIWFYRQHWHGNPSSILSYDEKLIRWIKWKHI